MNSLVGSRIVLEDEEFTELKEIIHKTSGICMTETKKNLLEHKLRPRLKQFNMISFSQYIEQLEYDEDEVQEMINAVTINKTYFFRELKHFIFLKNHILPHNNKETLRCWSTAGSNGAEAYSIAMLIKSNTNWRKFEVVYSDINTQMYNKAKEGIYPMSYVDKIPKKCLQQYCMQGFDENDGYFMIGDKLKKKLKFYLLNLTEPLQNHRLGMFDVIFLRNMIIYFDDEYKKIIVDNVIGQLKQGGYLFMGHSESLYGITDKVKQIVPSIYQKI